MDCHNCSEHWQLQLRNKVIVLYNVMSQKAIFSGFLFNSIFVPHICMHFAQDGFLGQGI